MEGEFIPSSWILLVESPLYSGDVGLKIEEEMNESFLSLNLSFVINTEESQAEVSSYLYAQPLLHSFNLFPFVEQVVRGDRLWSDIHLHPHSTPGRWVHMLDISPFRNDGTIAGTQRALTELLQRAPNLQHLKVDQVFGMLDWRSVTKEGLKCLEGIGVDSVWPLQLSFLKLLVGTKGLEVLRIYGRGVSSETPRRSQHHMELVDRLQFDHLHTLTLQQVKTGAVLPELIAADLPQLQRLALMPYCGVEGDLTYALEEAHGAKILSLTYLGSNEWPRIRTALPERTLELYQNVVHLAWLIPNSYDHLANVLTSTGSDNSHPLRTLIIPKWTSNASPTPGARNTPVELFSQLLTCPPPNLKRVIIDGYRWVNPELGARALMTGASGEMRYWAEKLGVKGIQLQDMERRGMPVVAKSGEVGRRRRRSSVRAGDGMSVSVEDRGDEDGG